MTSWLPVLSVCLPICLLTCSNDVRSSYSACSQLLHYLLSRCLSHSVYPTLPRLSESALPKITPHLVASLAHADVHVRTNVLVLMRLLPPEQMGRIAPELLSKLQDVAPDVQWAALKVHYALL